MDYTRKLADNLGEADAFYPAIYFGESVDSTNEWIKRLAREGAPRGTTACAEEQTAGKGRSGHVWVSPAGENIYFSILLRPSFPPEKAPGLTLVMGLSVTEALQRMGLPAGIKWPNDAVTGGKKVCGILTELMVEPGSTYYVVVGTGINVNQTLFAEEISRTATSVRLALREKLEAVPGESQPAAQPDATMDDLVDRSQVLAEVLKRFAENYAAYEKTGDLTGLIDSYNALLVNRGRQVRIEDPKGPYLAVSRGIDATGALLVEKENGEVVAVDSGEVSVRGLYGYV